MPLARDKPYTFVDGKKEDLSGASIFTPEWNQEELAKGTALTELIKDIAEIPDTGEPGAAEGYDAVTELCLRHLPFAHMVAPHVKASFLQRSSVTASSCCFQASWAGHLL
uniref:Uncharacterized protein n=1 Tax=Tetradesmus obliquus TaxID=3088 RepID=A0A383W1X9_TETOB